MPAASRLTHEAMQHLRGKRLHGALFSLLCAPLPSGRSKAAIVVSKKVAAKATDRNRIKRRARAAVASRLKTLGEPRALVFTAKKEASTASFAEIRADIEALVVLASRS
jgi:ribonuclease P protein component